MLKNLREKIAGFRRDRRGVAAVEFAFIAPIMLALYFMTVEAVQGIDTSKQLSRLGSMVADLVGQQDTLTKEALTGIMRVGQTTITVTGIKISKNKGGSLEPKVVWSGKLTNNTYSTGHAKNSIITVEKDIRTDETFLIKVEISLGYRPIIAWASGAERTTGLTGAFSNINMNEVYYGRPRIRSEIACSNC
jgi:Flp pilus assembly protein TadG